MFTITNQNRWCVFLTDIRISCNFIVLTKNSVVYLKELGYFCAQKSSNAVIVSISQ